MTGAGHAVELAGVTQTFGEVKAVDDLFLTVPSGSVFGFIGPNGSGKTTTIRMIVNIFYPDRGSVRVFGETMDSSRTGLIGYLPEERGLPEEIENLLILVYADQTNRSFVKYGSNYTPGLDDLPARVIGYGLGAGLQIGRHHHHARAGSEPGGRAQQGR